MREKGDMRTNTGNSEEIEMFGDKSKAKSSNKNPTWRENLSYYFSQYCGATSIHGVQYVGERNRLLVEKLVWSVIIFIVVSTCIFFITQAYYKWVTSPVIVTFATTETPISEIPFPAVTVIPMINNDNFSYTELLLKKANSKTGLTDDEEEYRKILSLVCDDIYEIDKSNEENLDVNLLLYELININPYYLNPNLSEVSWQGREPEDDNLFRMTFTPEGLAFTFNMFDTEDIFTKSGCILILRNTTKLKSGPKIHRWSLDDGYPKSAKLDTFPKRTLQAGVNRGLQVVMYANQSHLKNTCRNMFSGYMVTLHHPCEFPNTNSHFILPLNQAVFVAVKPKMTTVSERVKSYNPEDKKCFLSEERKLKYFNYYTQDNCVLECLLNQTVETCNCKPFYMVEYDDDVQICGRRSNSCMEEVEEDYISHIRDKCNCLASCTSLEYEIEISQASFDVSFVAGIKGNLGLESSLLMVYYKEMQFLTTERNELYGYVDFFSNTGGLLGLFIGISVTSMIEILYFLTLRLVCNIKKFGKRFWSGAPELMDTESSK